MLPDKNFGSEVTTIFTEISPVLNITLFRKESRLISIMDRRKSYLVVDYYYKSSGMS